MLAYVWDTAPDNLKDICSSVILPEPSDVTPDLRWRVFSVPSNQEPHSQFSQFPDILDKRQCPKPQSGQRKELAINGI